jgi:polysaccharide biosynthesis transport protein
MNTSPTPSQPAGLDLSDIYFVLFRHKWKILLCSLAGFGIAAAMFRNEAPPYQSEAKLLVRYIVTETKNGAPNSGGTSKIVPDERGASIMNTEVEILTSLDLARDVAQAVGPERILAKLGGGKDLGAATNYVKSNLSANAGPGSSVLHVVFKPLCERWTG